MSFMHYNRKTKISLITKKKSAAAAAAAIIAVVNASEQFVST